MPENQRREMGRKGRQIVEERFNWARIGRETIDLYRWVLGGGHPPPFVTTERTDG
jgi:glycosyltransferase involved in cell wall biosynthesis